MVSDAADALLARTPQARGFFTAGLDPAAPDLRKRFARFDQEDNWERRRRGLALANHRGVPSTQVALAWVLAQAPDVDPTIGPSRVPHLEDAVAALNVQLSPGERAWLNLEADRRL